MNEEINEAVIKYKEELIEMAGALNDTKFMRMLTLYSNMVAMDKIKRRRDQFIKVDCKKKETWISRDFYEELLNTNSGLRAEIEMLQVSNAMLADKKQDFDATG